VREIKPVDYRFEWAQIYPLLVEKIPLLVLAAFSCIVTFAAQQKGGAVIALKVLTPGQRIGNAFISYIVYIVKMIWPSDLAVYYPHPVAWPVWQVLSAVFLLTAITVTVILGARRFPYLPMGWLWFTGTLVPVIGVVQVGGHAVADRYTYIPLIGLFVMAAWGIPQLVRKWRYRKEMLVTMSFLVLSSLFAATWTDVGYWKDSFALFDHTLNVTSRNDVILIDRGVAYFELGNYRQAIEDFNRVIESNPKDSSAFGNRGEAYRKLGNSSQALSDCEKAIEIDPGNSSALITRAAVYGRLGDYRRAIEDLDRVVALNPEVELAEAYFNRGVAYSRIGDNRQAILDYDRAIDINPNYANAYVNRGNCYVNLGDDRQAILDYDRAIQVDPGMAGIYLNRAEAYGRLGAERQAITDFQKAARLGSEDAKNSLKSKGISW